MNSNKINRIAKTISAEITEFSIKSIDDELSEMKIDGYEKFCRKKSQDGNEWKALPQKNMKGFPEIYVKAGKNGGAITGYRFTDIDPNNDGNFDDEKMENYRGAYQHTMAGLLEEISIMMEFLQEYMSDKMTDGNDEKKNDSEDEENEESGEEGGGEDESGDDSLPWE